jgi:hypothetical protein
MKITIDLRSLQSGQVSGVENYTINLVENLLAIDQKNQYAFFYSGWKKTNLPTLRFINAEQKRLALPNKLANLAFKLKLLSLNKIIGPTLKTFFFLLHKKSTTGMLFKMER